MSERDFMINDPEKASDLRLRQVIEWHTEQIKELQDSIKAAQSYINEYQVILDRRALESYWKAHPNLLRLEVGDEILLTPEYVEWYESNTGQYSRYHAGEICHISTVISVEGKPRFIGTKEFGGRIPYGLTLKMRRAYLERESTHE